MTTPGFSPRRPHRETYPPHRFCAQAKDAMRMWDDLPRSERNAHIMSLALQAPNETLAAWVRSFVVDEKRETNDA